MALFGQDVLLEALAPLYVVPVQELIPWSLLVLNPNVPPGHLYPAGQLEHEVPFFARYVPAAHVILHADFAVEPADDAMPDGHAEQDVPSL